MEKAARVHDAHLGRGRLGHHVAAGGDRRCTAAARAAAYFADTFDTAAAVAAGGRRAGLGTRALCDAGRALWHGPDARRPLRAALGQARWTRPAGTLTDRPRRAQSARWRTVTPVPGAAPLVLERGQTDRESAVSHHAVF